MNHTAIFDRVLGAARRNSDPDMSPQSKDAGSSLILAIFFLFATGLVVLALVSWSGNSLVDTLKLNNDSSLEYTSGSAVQIEIQTLRYAYQDATSSAYNCSPGGGASYTLNNTSVSVYCSIVHNPDSATTRVVTMYVCSSSTSQSSCVSNPYLQAVVTFDDYNQADVDQCTSSSVQSTCGTAMAITSWIIV